MKEHTVAVQADRINGRVVRYPWHILEDKENTLILTCPSAKSARLSLYKYVREGLGAGWKVSTKVVDKTTLIAGRVG